jgi:hypothetical protein
MPDDLAHNGRSGGSSMESVTCLSQRKDRMDLQNIFQANRTSTERLKNIVLRLSKDELNQTLKNGWPVYVTLAHLAFWDMRVIHVIEMANKNHTVVAPGFDIQLNDILTPLLRIIPPEAAVELCIKTAGALDVMLEACSKELINELIKVNPRLIDRSLHRNSHLDSMEALYDKRKN